MTEKQRYLQNRSRVFEIYGIDPNDRSYDCHHIVHRSDIGNLVSSDFDVHAVSNLIPMKVEDHQQLHTRLNFVDSQESSATLIPRFGKNGIKTRKR